MFLVMTFILIKLVNFGKNPHLTKFPSDCLPKNGCSRVMIFNENHRDGKVEASDIFTINHIGVNNTIDIVKGCIDRQSQSRIESITRTPTGSFFHINIASIFWGFVDDMSVEIIQCYESSENNNEPPLAIQIQSQQRIGSRDLGVNPSRVANFYDCLETETPTMYISDRGNPCLANPKV